MKLRLLCLLLAVSVGHVHAMTGSDAFICDVIRYSTSEMERAEAELEATSRGICGFEKPPAPEPKKKKRNPITNPSERAEKAAFVGAMIWAISNGKIEGPVTAQPGGRPSPR